jgi:hypothetical protein
MMQEPQSLLETQKTLLGDRKTLGPMGLEPTSQEPPTMQVGQIQLVLKSLGVLRRQVGQQKQVLTMQGLQNLREDQMESVLMKQALKRLDQMKPEVLGQSLL